MAKKYSGVSFGGILSRVNVFGDKYYVVYGKGKHGYGYQVYEYSRWNKLFRRFYFLFPLLDVFLILGFVATRLMQPYMPKISGPSIEISPGVLEILAYVLPFVIIILEFSLLYIVIFKGVRTWHGSEHKLISAMENDDIDNAEKYDPIHERCGGTLMPTIILAGICWAFVASVTGFPFGQYTFMSFFIFLNVRYFHKYDKIGVWFGKWLQRHATVSEPEPWKINLGRIAVKQLVKAENGEEFRESAVLIR